MLMFKGKTIEAMVIKLARIKITIIKEPAQIRNILEQEEIITKDKGFIIMLMLNNIMLTKHMNYDQIREICPYLIIITILQQHVTITCYNKIDH